MRIYRVALILMAATIIYFFRLLFLGIAAILYIYFLPSLIAEKRNPLKAHSIFVFNLLTGWLIIPWIIALVLAYRMDSVPQSTA
ncbi:superinfection immunity protein [Massilia horti]|nr:superinfection immunity protein [Massilia horti]